MKRTAKAWLRGLVAATINGAASGVVLVIAEPTHFNIYEGRGKLITTSCVLGILGMANYLKQSPIWDDDDEPLDPRRLPP